MKKQEQVYVCSQCIHFVRHYVRFDEKYVEAFIGHCVFPRIKSRSLDAKACAHFEERLHASTK